MSNTMNLTEDGQWVSAEFQRIAQVIHDYDERLELAWVPPANRSLNEEHPYAIIYNDPSGRRDIVMRLRETEMDHRVLARLWSSDSKNNPNLLATIEAEEAARRAVELLRKEEEEQERRELAAWMVKAPVGARHNGMRLE